jgi:hypothetical protein
VSSFDPMAAAVDWLDAYRAATLSIVDLYAPNAVLECGCNGRATVIGHSALTEYWRRRFVEKPAGELQGLQMAGDMVSLSYEVPGGIVQATLEYNDAGQIVRSQCAPVQDCRKTNFDTRIHANNSAPADVRATKVLQREQ